MRAVITACALLILVPAVLLANPNSQFAFSYEGSALWKFLNHVVLQDHYAFCTARFGLIIFDISDSTTPTPISRMYFPDGRRQNIIVQANKIYLSDGTAGLRIIDVADIQHPKQIGQYDATADVLSTAVVGRHAYLAVWEQGLRILNIANPSAPVEEGRCDTAREAYDVKVVDSLAYVSTWNGGFQIISVADSMSPVLKSDCLIIDWLQGLVIKDSIVAVARGGNGLQLFNISDPDHPLPVGSWNSPGLSHDVAVEDTFAYVADDYYLQVLSIANPSAPYPLAGLWLPFNNDLALRNRCAYVATQDSLVVVNVAVPSDPQIIGRYFAGQASVGVALKSNLAILADENGSLQVVDIVNPKNPMPVGSVPTYRARDVAIAGNYAYVADDAEDLKVFDISIASSPHLEGACSDLPGQAQQVAVHDSVAFLTSSSSSLELVNVARPHAPFRITGFPISGNCWGVAAAGNFAYVASDRGGLTIVDVTNPQSPQLKGAYPSADGAAGVAVRDTLAYVVTSDGILDIINIARPQSPTFVSSFARSGKLRNITVSGKYAYFGGETDSIWAVDISNPLFPTLAGVYKTPGQTLDIAVSDSIVYVADYFGFLALNNGTTVGYPCGDCDGSKSIDIADVVYLIAYIFGGGPAPRDVRHGDVDCSNDTDIADVVYMISYIFGGGKPPCYGCP